MPFDIRDFSAALPGDRATIGRDRRLVATWLFAVAAMILVMIALGGATRLTGSGLSIMEWAPVRGALPPTTEAEWRRLFDLYREIPQYKLLHDGFGLGGFRRIFWLEWIHRSWGRLIGIAFLAPLAWLWATGRIERRLRPRLALLFLLGGLQGAVGWFMVASGFLPDSTAVSAYRLVVHLVLALALYSAIVWTGLSVLRPTSEATPAAGGATRVLLVATAVSLALTLVAGGFVAGIHAGLDYNTFPRMDGRWVPSGYGQLRPFWRNLTENVAAVQFDHRVLATVTALLTSAAVATGLFAPLRREARRALAVLGAAVVAQYGLGVATLLHVVPVGLAVAHQTLAVLVLTAALNALHRLRPGRGAPRSVARTAPQ